MLVDKHSDTDTGHVESIQKVLDRIFSLLVNFVRFFEFEDPLSHGGYNISVPVSYSNQTLAEPATSF